MVLGLGVVRRRIKSQLSLVLADKVKWAIAGNGMRLELAMSGLDTQVLERLRLLGGICSGDGRSLRLLCGQRWMAGDRSVVGRSAMPVRANMGVECRSANERMVPRGSALVGVLQLGLTFRRMKGRMRGGK